jgi:hypothetical protein
MVDPLMAQLLGDLIQKLEAPAQAHQHRGNA